MNFTFSRKETRTARNILIFHLAISDILTVCSLPLTLVDGLNMSWTLPRLLPLCRMVKILPCLAVFMSSLTIIAIAADRHRVIISPDRLQVGAGQAWASLPVIFLLSALLSSPLYFNTKFLSLGQILVK